MRDVATFLWSAWWRDGIVAKTINIVLVTVPAVLGVVLGLTRDDLAPWWTWLLILLVAILGTLIVGIVRPALVLQRAFEPKVKITGPDILTHPKQAADRAIRTIRIVVENVSAAHLRNCSVREAEFVNHLGWRSGLQRYFRLAEEGHADMGAHTFRRVFDLRGKGDRQVVEIAHLDETQEDSRVIMLYATDPTAQTLNAIPRAMFPHDLTVSFTADDLPVPAKGTFRLAISDEGRLTMTMGAPGDASASGEKDPST
jgi:hypothetical protein